jgi:hypothetical protein
MFPPFLIDQEFWRSVAIVAVTTKVLSAVISLRWTGGSERILASKKGKIVYFMGKVTPIIAVGAVLMRIHLADPTINPAWWVLAFAAVIVYVAAVVWLRFTHRWYGVAHMIRSWRSRGLT